MSQREEMMVIVLFVLTASLSLAHCQPIGNMDYMRASQPGGRGETIRPSMHSTISLSTNSQVTHLLTGEVIAGYENYMEIDLGPGEPKRPYTVSLSMPIANATVIRSNSYIADAQLSVDHITFCGTDLASIDYLPQCEGSVAVAYQTVHVGEACVGTDGQIGTTTLSVRVCFTGTSNIANSYWLGRFGTAMIKMQRSDGTSRVIYDVGDVSACRPTYVGGQLLPPISIRDNFVATPWYEGKFKAFMNLGNYYGCYYGRPMLKPLWMNYIAGDVEANSRCMNNALQSLLLPSGKPTEFLTNYRTPESSALLTENPVTTSLASVAISSDKSTAFLWGLCKNITDSNVVTSRLAAALYGNVILCTLLSVNRSGSEVLARVGITVSVSDRALSLCHMRTSTDELLPATCLLGRCLATLTMIDASTTHVCSSNCLPVPRVSRSDTPMTASTGRSAAGPGQFASADPRTVTAARPYTLMSTGTRLTMGTGSQATAADSPSPTSGDQPHLYLIAIIAIAAAVFLCICFACYYKISHRKKPHIVNDAIPLSHVQPEV